MAPATRTGTADGGTTTNHNVARVLQIEKFRPWALARRDRRVLCQRRRGDGSAVHAGGNGSGSFPGAWRSCACGRGERRLSIQLMTLPAVTCCTRRCGAHHRGRNTTPCTTLRPVRPSGLPPFPRADLPHIGADGLSGQLYRRRAVPPIRCAFPCGRGRTRGGGDAAGGAARCRCSTTAATTAGRGIFLTLGREVKARG